MFTKVVTALLALSLLGAAAVAAPAQQIPSPAQAQQMLKADPSLAGRIQQMMQASGMTPEQIRERLKAQGYPESLLDQYLPGGSLDSTQTPGADVFAAVRALGLADSSAVDSLSAVARSRRRVQLAEDSAFLDTLRGALKNDSTAAAIRSLLRSRELQTRELDSGFTVFGLDFFASDKNPFDGSLAGGADPNYRFGPGDHLVLILTGDVEKSYKLDVTREGFVVIPDIGTITVAGLTRSQLEDALYTRLARVYPGVGRGQGASTRFYIDVSQMGTNQIFVSGDVKRPASYRVSRGGTAMTALYAAGGPSASGSMRDVQVRRNGELVATLDLYDYVLRGDASHDVRLENGDVIFVPPRGARVRVAGAVLRPAMYEVKPAETVADVIRMAGGFDAAADTRRLEIERILPPDQRTSAGTDRRMIDVASDLFPSAPVHDGDVIRVRAVAAHVANRIAVKGNVWAPGTQGITSNMTLYDALRRAGGLKPDSYLGQVLVSRLRPDSTREMLRTAVYDTTGRPVTNLALRDGDVVDVFSVTDFRPERYITVNGAVRKPGRIPYHDGMTLRDAILLSGGLEQGAFLQDAEVARLPENRAAGVTARTMEVPLDSSYVFDRVASAGGGADGGGAPSQQGLARRVPDFTLQPYDAVLIRRTPGWDLQQMVSVQGEVKYPGDYALTTLTERLSDILQRAGGLTDRAYAGGVVFVRKRNSIGRIGIDLSRVLRDPKFVDNLQLLNGDSVFIPPYVPVVAVKGAVYSPVSVAYVPGAKMDYYIRAAGGENAKGDGGRAYVMQPNGKVESRHHHFFGWTGQPTPAAGSTITVPEKDPNDKRDWLQIATAATSILGSLVAISAIVRR